MFWNSAAMEPKRNMKFVLYMNGIKSFIVKKVKRPSPSIGEAEHVYLGNKFYYPGIVSWEAIEITLVDIIDPNAAAKMREIIHNSGYSWIRPRNVDPKDLSTISKLKSVTSLGNITIEHINSNGDTVDTWKLINPWLKKVDFSELSYINEDLSEITLTIRFDYATHEDTERSTDLASAARRI